MPTSFSYPRVEDQSDVLSDEWTSWGAMRFLYQDLNSLLLGGDSLNTDTGMTPIGVTMPSSLSVQCLDCTQITGQGSRNQGTI